MIHFQLDNVPLYLLGLMALILAAGLASRATIEVPITFVAFVAPLQLQVTDSSSITSRATLLDGSFTCAMSAISDFISS